MDKGPYHVLESREVYRNPFISVREDKVIRPGGSPGAFGIVEMKPGSSVLAIDREGNAHLAREYKYAQERDTLEVISGGIDQGESPEDAARRELAEEAGLQSERWIPLGRIDPFTTIIRSPNYLFLALDCEPQGAQNPGEGEVVHLEKVPFRRALQMVMDSEITHGGSCVAILKARDYMR